MPSLQPTKLSTRRKLEAAFAAADADNSGEVDVGELQHLLARLGVERTAAECDELVKRVDADRSGHLSIDEVSTLFQTTQLRDTFNAIDEDGSGAIGADELSGALKKLGYNVSDQQCQELLRKVDQNADGSLTFDEFVQFFEFVPLASLGSIATHLMGRAVLDVGSDLAPPVPPGKGGDIPVGLVLLTGGVAGCVSRTATGRRNTSSFHSHPPPSPPSPPLSAS